MTLRLYGYWRSSSTWRVRIGLGLKGIAWEPAIVNLLAGEQFSEAHRARSPLAMVPVLEVEDGNRTLRLVQSMAILEWLDETHPEPPLLPADPAGRARVRALAEHVNSSIQPLQNSTVLKALREKLGPGADKAWAAHWIANGLAALERAVNDGGAGRFCHGDRPGLAEAYLVPQLYNARRFGLDVAPYPTLLRIEAACAALPAFAAAHPDRQPDAPPPEGRTP
ncbi:MAG TPA: maleylacetoacetate isomerase [Anaeromyxobacteraceae bacterium]|nr:maleylacetoacetate isomerase [Anaeromyxobacteraceae bacterium]